MKAQRSEALSGVAVASGSAGQRRATFERALLLAPFNGIVTRRVRDPGNTVNVGSPVLRIVDTERVYVRAWIDESLVTSVSEGQDAELVFPGDGARLPATVLRIGGEADRQTHEVLVDLAPSKGLGGARIGQRVDVWIRTETRPAAVRVPAGFLRRERGGYTCVVDRQGRTAVIPIEIGRIGRDQVEVLSGLNEGDTVLRPVYPGGTIPVRRRWKALS